MRIVRAKAWDMPRILAIERACFGRDAWDERLFRAYLDAWPELFLLAKRGVRTAGYSIAVIRGERADLESIAVDPRSKRRGIGSALVRKTLTLLRRRGVASAGLMVEVDNAAAIALYQQFGFRRTRTIRNYYGARRHGWRMSMALERRSW